MSERAKEKDRERERGDYREREKEKDRERGGVTEREREKEIDGIIDR